MSDDSLNLEAFETTVSDLGKHVYSDDVKNEVTKLLAALPSPDDVKGDVAKKVRLLTLRAKARLLLPAYNKDAEADLAKALKLKPTDTNAWVAMSECHWKRSAVKEARDALHSALSIDANHIGALVQLSRVLRSLCSQANTTAEEQAVLLEESVSKARAAVALDPNAGEAWSALGIALMQQTVSTGMNLLLLRKALQALTQAARKAEYDPDVHYNRGVVFRCLGEYGNAHVCFKKAFELDPKGLAGAAKDAERCAGIVTGFKGILHTFATDEDRQRDLKKNVTSKIPIAEKPNGSHSGRDYNVLSQLLRPAVSDAGRWGCVKVLDMISSRSEQPLCFVAADREGTIAAVLVYRVLPSAIKTGDTLFLGVPPCAVAVVEHSLPGEPGSEPTTLRLTTVTVDPAALFVNGAPIGAGQYKMPMLATRQFA